MRRIYIEGYDARNFGDVSMLLGCLRLIEKLAAGAEVVLPRPVPLDLDMLFPGLVLAVQRSDLQTTLSKGYRRLTRQVSSSARLSPAAVSSGCPILYCCGYVFGDTWPIERVEAVSEDIRRASINGSRVVMMPQSFGPLSGDHLRAARRAVESAEIVFARDASSYEHLISVNAGRSNIQRSVDYTGLINGLRATPPVSPEGHICIIPNVKISETYGAEGEAQYVKAIAEMVQAASDEIGVPAHILRHTSGKDDGVAARLSRDLGITLLPEMGPLECRGYIAGCALVISSRFHGVAHSLSQGVPVVAIGWAAKYSELMKMYDVPELSYILNGDREASSFAAEVARGLATWRDRIRAGHAGVEEKYRYLESSLGQKLLP